LASTFPTESASSALLDCVLGDNPWPDYLLRRALLEDDGRLLFSVVIERMGDLFEPRLCDTYARLFARVIELLRPEMKAIDLLNRYERVRQIRPCSHTNVQNVFVLSRVTLGADVAVTSVMLDALKRRFPTASIYLVGSRKNQELFAADLRIQHMPYPYPRAGSLLERLNQWGSFDLPNSIVVDPDSRLTQLGMLPVCAEDDYFFFESRAYGEESSDALPVLAARWVKEVFGNSGRAFVAPEPVHMPCDAAVSFGVGENEEKRLADPFEENVLRGLVERGLSVMLDKGAGGQEAQRAEVLARRVRGVETFTGPYAPFAGMISRAKLYVGYDSAGQHVAAACGVPLVSVFAGYASDRMFERWKPWGPGRREIVKVTTRQPNEILTRTMAAVDRLLS
jgi:hypothetical protein